MLATAPALRMETPQHVREMARVVKGRGAVQKDGIRRKAAVQVKPKKDVREDDLEVARIVSTHGQLFEIELANGRTYQSKVAKKLRYFGIKVRIGDEVQVQFDPSMGNDQIPTIIARAPAESEK
eukprot:CAMPEP_0182804216 /NCGR_PEP_ID=MMETSP0006_2-20121128/4434_1 /TAXON_ID=97485 /ORGANISM="Prymnesium parvum, Strain Texoma1" /LENGTH=123 /DNA_ID=CAMNT_0024929723 /DNA_START=1 /DNA_END=372 /DNA_ORIENTATION=+